MEPTYEFGDCCIPAILIIDGEEIDVQITSVSVHNENLLYDFPCYCKSEDAFIYGTSYSTTKFNIECKNEKIVGKTISVNIKKPDFKLYQKSITLPTYVKNKNEIFEIATKLFKENFLGQVIRQVGITLSNVVKENSLYKKVSLFEENKTDFKEDKIYDCLNSINKKFNKKIIIKGKDLKNN